MAWPSRVGTVTLRQEISKGPMNQFHKAWGDASSFLLQTPKKWWVDLCVLLGGAGLVVLVATVAQEWQAPVRPTVEIDLSASALPKYACYSLSRGLIAYLLSLAFTLGYGYWAARDHRAEKVLVPLLDILQSVPVLGFLPGLVLALAALFPSNNIGLELASVLMIFTGQAWNMTFSFYHSLKALPSSLKDAADVYRFNWRQRALRLELPFAAIGLIWNSMMSMAGGWFFLMISEAFVLGDKDFRLPGLGSYMSVAMEKGDWGAMGLGVVTMVTIIVLLDQLLWQPMVAWGQKFRMEERAEEAPPRSWFLDLLKRSKLVAAIREWSRRAAVSLEEGAFKPDPLTSTPERTKAPLRVLSLLAFFGLLSILGFGIFKIVSLFAGVSPSQWLLLFGKAFATLARVLFAVALGLLWTVPVGLWIGLSPRLSRMLQPVIQIIASFPAPMIFPVAILLMAKAGIPLSAGSVFLMLLGVQWYILFNVVAGATAIPSDLKEAARVYRFGGWQRFKQFYLPCIFPYLITGMVAAAGGAWNASIVAEYVTFKGKEQSAWGLGSQISLSASQADFPMLAAGVVVMALVVVTFNRLVWDKLSQLAEHKYAMNK